MLAYLVLIKGVTGGVLLQLVDSEELIYTSHLINHLRLLLQEVDVKVRFCLISLCMSCGNNLQAKQ